MSVAINAINFPDANFRAAIQRLSVSRGGTNTLLSDDIVKEL